MAFLDYPGLTKFKNKFKNYLDGIFIKSVNSNGPDANGNVDIDKVAFADNLIADDAQSSSGLFVTRTTGGDASLSDGDAWLNVIRGNSIHTGYSPRNVNMTVAPVATVDRVGTITAAINRNTFVESMNESALLVLNYTTAWSSDPTLYGITVTGTPAYGDKITVDYTKEILNMAISAASRPTPAGITAELDKDTFIEHVSGASGTYTLSYTSSWSESPALYGVTVSGTPESGDSIVITYDGENDPEMSVNSPRTPAAAITAELNKATFRSYVSESGTINLTYTTSWSADPTLYGVTVTGTPINGDKITINYTKEVIDETVDAVTEVARENPITAVIDEEAFDNAVQDNGTTVFEYTDSWDNNPASYGITVTGTPVDGDKITVVCTKEVRGTITVFNPSQFYSTNWNLYNNDLGYARTIKYSSSYGFILGGTFTAAEFSTTNDSQAEKTALDLVDMGDGMYYFEVEEDGFVWLTGANDTDTYILMTWSDWQSGPPATFAAHSASTVDLTDIIGAETHFPYGLMKVDNVADEINLSLQTAFSHIERMPYSAANLATVRATGRPYEYDENYIYVVKEEADAYEINLDGLYLANDHGLEVFTNTFVPGYAQMLYGQNLKDKLRTDVVTISSQTLSSTQQNQIRNNIGAVATVNGLTPNSSGAVSLPTDTTPTQNSSNYVTSGGVYTQIAAINQRIGNVESPASVFQDLDFTIPTTAWTGNAAPYTAVVTSATVTSTSGIWVFYDSSYTSYAKDAISASVTSGGGSVTFTTNVKPTAAITGYIRVVDSVNGIIPIERGGTGANTLAAAQTNLGIADLAEHLASIESQLPARNTFSLTAKSGVTFAANGGIRYGKVCTLTINMKRSSAGSGWTTMATVPSGYRPSGWVYFLLADDEKFSGNTTEVVECRIGAEGNVDVYAPPARTLWGGCSYII